MRYVPDPQADREVFAVLVQHEGRATVIDGTAFDSREVADRVAANVAECHPDVRVVRLPVRSTPATWHGLPVVDQDAFASALTNGYVDAQYAEAGGYALDPYDAAAAESARATEAGGGRG